MNLEKVKYLILASMVFAFLLAAPNLSAQVQADTEKKSCAGKCRNQPCQKTSQNSSDCISKCNNRQDSARTDERSDTTITEEPAVRPSRTIQSNESESRSRLDQIVSALNLKPRQVVVDIGAGRGIMTRRFAEAVGADGKAIGIEISPEMVRRMTADAEQRNLPNYEARLALPDDPMLEENSADIIFLKHTYHHIENRIQYFANLRKALRPDGRLVIIDFSETSRGFYNSSELRLTRKEVIAELEQAGYRLVREFDFLLPNDYFLEFEVADKLRTSKNSVSLS